MRIAVANLTLVHASMCVNQQLIQNTGTKHLSPFEKATPALPFLTDEHPTGKCRLAGIHSRGHRVIKLGGATRQANDKQHNELIQAVCYNWISGGKRHAGGRHQGRNNSFTVYLPKYGAGEYAEVDLSR